MASYRPGNFDLRTCPYDPSHKVSITKFAGHVAKCAKSQKTAELLECPFYAGHRLRREDYELHVTQQCTYMQQDLLSAVLAKFRNDETLSAGHRPAMPPSQTPVRYDSTTGQELWE